MANSHLHLLSDLLVLYNSDFGNKEYDKKYQSLDNNHDLLEMKYGYALRRIFYRNKFILEGVVITTATSFTLSCTIILVITVS